LLCQAENELDANISGFHLNALSSGLPLNVDLDTTLTALASNCYRLLARKLPRYELATLVHGSRHLEGECPWVWASRPAMMRS